MLRLNQGREGGVWGLGFVKSTGVADTASRNTSLQAWKRHASVQRFVMTRPLHDRAGRPGEDGMHRNPGCPTMLASTLQWRPMLSLHMDARTPHTVENS